jgi:membrane protease YdiL (CAAX protease family)
MEAGVRPVPWSRGTTVRWLLGGLLLAIIVPPLLVAPFDPDLKGDGALLAAQAMFDGLLLFVAVGVASDWRFSALAGPLRLLGLRPFRPSAIWLLLGTLVVYYIAAGLFASLVLKPDQEDIGGELGVGNPSIVIAVLAVVMIVGLAPIAEELFFRGIVFNAWLREAGLVWAYVGSAALFAAIHLSLASLLPIFLLGLALAWVYRRTGSLLAPIVMHATVNGISVAVALAVRFASFEIGAAIRAW